jgi:hypothetical protein
MVWQAAQKPGNHAFDMRCAWLTPDGNAGQDPSRTCRHSNPLGIRQLLFSIWPSLAFLAFSGIHGIHGILGILGIHGIRHLAFPIYHYDL